MASKRISRQLVDKRFASLRRKNKRDAADFADIARRLAAPAFERAAGPQGALRSLCAKIERALIEQNADINRFDEIHAAGGFETLVLKSHQLNAMVDAFHQELARVMKRNSYDAGAGSAS